MNDRPASWRSFVAALPSNNPFNHEFLVAQWCLEMAAFHLRESGPFKFLSAIQGLALVIALTVFVVDIIDRREERAARKLTAVSGAYSILDDVARSVDKDEGLAPYSRRQMIALEELHKYSQIDDGKYLASLVAVRVPFSLSEPENRSGCDRDHDPRRVVLRDAHLNRAVLNRSIFNRADIRRANLYASHLVGTNFTNACLVETNFEFSCLCDADMTGADLSNANMKSVKLSGAWLVNANLSGANLKNADLSNSILIGTNFSDANLQGTNLSGARFSGNEGLKDKQLVKSCINEEEARPIGLPSHVEPPPVDTFCTDGPPFSFLQCSECLVQR